MRTLKAIRVNAGVSAAYQKELDELVQQMQKSLMYFLGMRYKSLESDITFDASPVPQLQSVLDKLTRRWKKNIYERADELALKFAWETQKHTDISFRKALKSAGFSFDFKMTDGIRTTLQSSVAQNVGLIRSIADENLSQVNQIVMNAVQNGGSWGGVQEQLQERYGITRRRANLIVRDQASKATSAFNKQRQIDMGLFDAQWVHSAGGKYPRPSHVKAGRDKLVFDVRKGAYLDNKWTWPGHEINCGCVSRTVMPF